MPHVNKGRAPDEPRETDIPEQLATPFGDYCDAWDVEQNEFDDLEFLKLIDKHLFNTKKTHPRSDDDVLASGEKHMVPAHLFDLLGLDRLPDLIDNDDDAKKVFDLLRTGLKHLQDNQSDDLASVLANIEAVKKFYSTFKLK